MRKIILSLSTLLLLTSIGFAQNTPDVTSWIRNTTGQTGYGGILSNVQAVQYDTTYTYVSCTCIPGYSIGPWIGNPNVPANQNFVFQIPRHPVQNNNTATTVGLGHIGVWSNGVSIFNVSDAMSYNNQGIWNRNAFFWEGPGFDACLGHPQQQGEYHHHVSPNCLYDQTDSTHHSPIIGYAFDGFPVYGAYAFTNTNGTGPIKRMKSSYILSTNTTRVNGPAVDTTYPEGSFIEDFSYQSGFGDLDARNGRFSVTPDYPNGIYAYFVTIDDSLRPIFPYTFYGSYYGVVATGDIGPGSGHVTITDSTTIYTSVPEINRHIKFELYPNPAKDYAYIYFDPMSSNNIKGTLYDAKGQLLKTINNMQPSISYSLDLSKYRAGIYFLHLQTDKETVVQKIVRIK